MLRKLTGLNTAILMLAMVSPAIAQQPAKVARIGYLSSQSLSAMAARTDAFRQGLHELGYLEGKSIVIGVSR